ncbi:DUF6933 domain-containing protein [Chloroflexota bacterium]
MGVIRCTRKLLSELQMKSGDYSGQSAGIGGWHANLLRIDRRKCVLFTNDQTLYTFLVTGMKKPEFENILEVFRLNLFKNLAKEKLPQSQVELVFSEHRELLITRTSSRSVLGSMNDLANQARYLIYDMGGLSNIDHDILNYELNRTPMGAIGYRSSREELHKSLNQIETQ